MHAAGICRDVETAQEASCEAALDQLQRSKRKMLPIVNAAGELVSPPSSSVETVLVCFLDICQHPAELKDASSLPSRLVASAKLAQSVCMATPERFWRSSAPSPNVAELLLGLTVIDEVETSQSCWLHA